MAGSNPDATPDALFEFPETVDGARLVGVDATGVPLYFDEADGRAFEALRSDCSWVVGEERTSTKLSDVISDIEQMPGWDALTSYGSDAEE